MSYWDEVKEVLKKGANLASEGIKEGTDYLYEKTKGGTGTIIDRTKDGVEFVKLKSDLFLKQREFRTVLADIGDATLALYREKGELYENKKIQKLVTEAEDIEKECRDLQDKINTLKETSSAKEQETKKEEKKTAAPGSETLEKNDTG